MTTLRSRPLLATLVLAVATLAADAAHAQTRVIADLSRAEVHGLFNTLHRSRDWVAKTLKLKGSTTRSRFRATRFTPMISAEAAKKFDSFRQPWVADVVHEGLFLLRDVMSTGVSRDGASVITTQRAEGTQFVVQSGYRFTWLPESRTLLVEPNDALGRVSQVGEYTVSARSATKIETEQGSLGFERSSGSFGFNFSKASSAALSFFDARIRGNPYRIERGRFQTVRGMGVTRGFVFDLEWASEALMDYQARLVNNGQQVSSTLTFKFLRQTQQPGTSPGASGTPSGQGGPMTTQPSAPALPPTAFPALSEPEPTQPSEGSSPAAGSPSGSSMIGVATQTETRAATTAEAFLSQVRYEARPAILNGPDGMRELGQLVRHTISIDDLGAEFVSAQTLELRSANSFDLSITAFDRPIAIALGSRALGDTSAVAKRFTLPVVP